MVRDLTLKTMRSSSKSTPATAKASLLASPRPGIGKYDSLHPVSGLAVVAAAMLRDRQCARVGMRRCAMCEADRTIMDLASSLTFVKNPNIFLYSIWNPLRNFKTRNQNP